MVNQISKIEKDLQNFVGTLTKTIAYDLRKELFDVTPVETGWAKNNWIPSIGQPETDTLPGDRTSDPINTSKMLSGVEELDSYEFGDGNIYITNNANYIQALNDGHSKQAPQNFVQTAMLKTVKKDVRKLARIHGAK
jgi:uncharacterized protein CbrC (UPF0167 family)